MFFALIVANNVFRTIQTLVSSIQHIDEIVSIRNDGIAFATAKQKTRVEEVWGCRIGITENIPDDSDVLCIVVLWFPMESCVDTRHN